MGDRTVSALHVAAGALWTAGVFFVGVYMVFAIRGTGLVGVMLAGAGGVTNIKAMLAHLEDREKRAFELGRDYEHGRLTPVR